MGDLVDRIRDAMERAPNIGTQRAFALALRVDQRQVARWISKKSPTAPSPSRLVTICEVLEVSADWLLTGRDALPEGYALWLENRRDHASSDRLRTYLRELPLEGYRATLDFYDLATDAYYRGLHKGRDPKDFVSIMRHTMTHRPVPEAEP